MREPLLKCFQRLISNQFWVIFFGLFALYLVTNTTVINHVILKRHLTVNHVDGISLFCIVTIWQVHHSINNDGWEFQLEIKPSFRRRTLNLNKQFPLCFVNECKIASVVVLTSEYLIKRKH